MKEVRIGVIGLSGRGAGMLSLMLDVPGVVCPTVCDRVPERAADGLRRVKEHENYTGYEINSYTDYKQMLAKEKLDGVYIATTWITHSRIAADAMRAGIHAGVEVGGAASEAELRELVDVSRDTGKFCMLMENCCYDRKEMAVYKMVKEGRFGEIIHCEGGYRHDLREEIVMGRENIHGRLFNFQHRNGELYPTHQLGPIAKLLDINRGNRFVSLVSMSSKARGLNEWIKTRRGEDYDLYGYDFAEGDVVTTIIKCARGETITLTHGCSLPRPYWRNYLVEGTKGVFYEATDSQWLFAAEGITESGERWESFNDRITEFEHPLWKEYLGEGVKKGHGGMDYLVLESFADAVRAGEAPIDTYDTASLMAITYLSEQSVAMGGMPVPVPDFTNGTWIDREPYRKSKFCLNEVCPVDI